MKLSTLLNSRIMFVCFAVLLGTYLLNTQTASAESIDMKDWYILDHDSQWHYTGSGQTGSSVDDDFTNTVLDDLQPIMPILAKRMLTTTDEPTDDLNGNEAFWYVDPADGKVYFYGFKNANADDLFAAQIVTLSKPLLIGQNEQPIPSTVIDSSPVSIQFIGQPVPFAGTITSTIIYQELIPVVQTPLGAFTNVLRLLVSFEVDLGFESFIIQSGEFLLKENVGMIMHDQNVDLNDAEIQAIDSGIANGTVIVPDSSIEYALEDNIKTLQVVSGLAPAHFYLKQDINGDGKAGTDDAVFSLQRSAGMIDLTMESSAFEHLDPIPIQHTVVGSNISPKLTWNNPPAGTLSYVLIVDDPDAIQVADKVWDHWLVYNIPGSENFLSENAGVDGSANLPTGALHGTNSDSVGKNSYRGPDPPSGNLHRYFFHLYALKVATITPVLDTTKSSIKKAMEGHILGEATLVGTFEQ